MKLTTDERVTIIVALSAHRDSWDKELKRKAKWWESREDYKALRGHYEEEIKRCDNLISKIWTL